MMEDQATKQTSEEVLASIGAELASARRERKQKITDIAEKLRILPDHITAIEQGRVASLPSMTYVIGYVRSYANLVGADAAPMCRRLRDSLSPDQVTPEYHFVQSKIRPNSNAGMVAIAALGACFFLYAGWYVIDVSTSPNDPDKVEVAAMLEGADDVSPAAPLTELEESRVDPLAASLNVAEEITPDLSASVEAGAGASNTLEETIRPAPSASQDLAAAETTAESIPAQPVLEEAAVPAEPATTSATQAMAVGRLPDLDMTIHAVAASWVEITRADGSRVSAWLMQKGESYTIPGGDDLYLTTGNAGGLEMMIGQDEKFLLGEWGETVEELPLDKSLIKTRP